MVLTCVLMVEKYGPCEEPKEIQIDLAVDCEMRVACDEAAEVSEDLVIHAMTRY